MLARGQVTPVPGTGAGGDIDDEHALARLLESLSSASAEELLSELETAALGNPRRQPRDDVAMLMLRVPIGGEVDHERPAESADARP